MTSPYEVLGLQENASLDEVKSKYKKLAKQYHPDVNKEPGAEEKFKQITEAYDNILNPKPQEQTYTSGNPFSSPFDFFNFDIFNNRQSSNMPIQASIQLDIQEVFQDITKSVTYNRIVSCNICSGRGGQGKISTCTVCMGSGQNKRTISQGNMFFQQILGPCQKCSGSGKFYENLCTKCNGNGTIDKTENIELNIKKGSLFKAIVMENMGHQNDPKFKAGHLIIEVNLKQHSSYEFDRNYNLMLNCHIDPVQAILGGAINLKHPNGESFTLVLNPYTPNDFRMKTNATGLPKSENQYGDLLVRILYKTPNDLNVQEQNLLQDYLKSRTDRGVA